jgi:soluble lytic murein transglycosylase-like protein
MLALAWTWLAIPAASSSPVYEQAASGPAEVAPEKPAVGGIKAVQENGRIVYVNSEDRPKSAAEVHATSVRPRTLVYWSSVERRWKPVPAPSAAAMAAARNAAAEVASYISARPKGSAAFDASANPNYSGVARGYQVSAVQIDQAIEESARKHSVDPNLVRAMIKVESNFNPKAVSRTGAMGLMQLMPSTARQLSVTNPFDPQQNVDAGVRHLKHLLNNFGGDVKLTLAAYNAGEGAVARSNGVPPYRETRDYVKRITDIYGSNGVVRTPGASSMPVRISRGADGVIRMTNTE